MATGRNAPCPCGSGKKHKHCCLGKLDPRVKRKMIAVMIGAAVLTAVAAGYIGWASGARNGLLAALGGVVGIGIYAIVRNPPKRSNRAGADRIDFGR